MSRSLLVSAVLSLLASAALAGGESWTQDFAAAQAKAKAENKDLLLDFTGSDWCSWCIKLDKEVFADATFDSEVQKSFVLVKLDYPRNKSLVTEQVAAQNEELQKRYGIRGYPTIYLTDWEGNPYAKTGYKPGGPTPYLEHLAELRTAKTTFRDAMTAADAAKGIDRAKALDKALGALDDEIVQAQHLAKVEEIVKLDADGAAGLKPKYEAKLAAFRKAAAEEEVQTTVSSHFRKKDFKGGIAALALLAEKHKGTPEVAQMAVFYQALGHAELKNTDEAIAMIEKARALAPDSEMAQNADSVIEQIKAKGAEPDDDGN